MNRRLLSALLGLALAVSPALAADAPAPAPLEAYAAVGASLVRDNRLAQLGWSEAQIEAFLRGVRAGFRGEGPSVDTKAQGLLNDIGRRMQELEQAELKSRYGAEAFARPGYLAEYMKEKRKQFGLEATDSGLSYGMRSAGSGVRPAPEDTIVISYKVTGADAQTELPQLKVEKLKVKLSDLLPGLAEGFQMMTVESIAMMILPPDLTYGDGPWPPGTERGTPLIYTMKLHEVISHP